MKLSTICYVAAGLAITVNPWMVLPWVALGAVNTGLEHSKSPEAALKTGSDALAQMLLTMKPTDAVKFIRTINKPDGSEPSLREAVDMLKNLSVAYPQYAHLSVDKN